MRGAANSASVFCIHRLILRSIPGMHIPINRIPKGNIQKPSIGKKPKTPPMQRAIPSGIRRKRGNLSPYSKPLRTSLFAARKNELLVIFKP